MGSAQMFSMRYVDRSIQRLLKGLDLEGIDLGMAIMVRSQEKVRNITT
ncbi:hypothetical protein CCACVL1_13234 [Corchorus capsularis]|uniref:Uncharacterized protein n=1 Tax=Corchorus capsularis TaxID=210143 RepID=A0A1R3IBT5_COCAP|nr:hypothetical protein CCACVL1_13234 [Corchorus capsularis]